MILFTGRIQPKSPLLCSLLCSLLMLVAAPGATSAPESRIESGAAAGPGQDPIQQIENDPELSALQALDEAALDAWNEGLLCHLLRSPRPRVQLVAADVVRSLRHRTETVCPAAGGAVDPVAVQRRALAVGWEDPGVLLHVYQDHCQGRGPADWADCQAVQDQLVAIDGDNAAVLLLPLVGHVVSRSEMESLVRNAGLLPEIGETLARAAEGSRFDLYPAAGWADVYEEILLHAAVHSPPEPAPVLLEVWEEADRRAPDPIETAMLMMHMTSLGPRMYSFNFLHNQCGAARKAGMEEVVRACLTLADLMRDRGRTAIDVHAGRVLRRELERPETSTADGTEQYPERWRRQVHRIVQVCEQPRLFSDPTRKEPFPPDHLRHFYRDFEAHGEVEAFKRAAVREHALYPELYQIDPSDCRRIYDLSEEDQRAIAKLGLLGRAPGSDQWTSEAVEGLAVMLYQPPAGTEGLDAVD